MDSQSGEEEEEGMYEEGQCNDETQQLNTTFDRLRQFVDEANRLQHSLHSSAMPWFVCWHCEKLMLDRHATYLAIDTRPCSERRPFCNYCIGQCAACHAWYNDYTRQLHADGACTQQR